MSANDENTKPTVIILLGAPGSGKGTLAAEFSKKKNLPHISTGDLFYENARNKTELGVRARTYLDKGQLVPDDLVLDIVYDRISRNDCSNGYILDGIPKNIAQVHELEDYLRNKAVVVAIKLEVSDEIAVARLAGRVLCLQCGHVWNKEQWVPKVEGICDICGGELQKRSDDTPEAIKERINVYNLQTKPLERFYKEAGQLKVIDASKPAKDVLEELESIC